MQGWKQPPRQPCAPIFQDNIELCTAGHTKLLSHSLWQAHGHWYPMDWIPTPSTTPPPWPERQCLSQLIQWIRGFDGERGRLCGASWPWGNVSLFWFSMSPNRSLSKDHSVFVQSYYSPSSSYAMYCMGYTLPLRGIWKILLFLLQANHSIRNAMCFLVATTMQPTASITFCSASGKWLIFSYCLSYVLKTLQAEVKAKKSLGGCGSGDRAGCPQTRGSGVQKCFVNGWMFVVDIEKSTTSIFIEQNVSSQVLCFHSHKKIFLRCVSADVYLSSRRSSSRRAYRQR